MTTHEFKCGDIVTFNAYIREEIKAKVVGIRHFDEKVGLPEYELEGVSKPLISSTTGRSIRESKHFVEPGEFVW